MVTTASRTASPARWTRAAQRAAVEGVRVMQLPTTGVWVATSGTDARTAYVVTPTDCECYAGANGDQVCKHRAALQIAIGMMAAPVAPVAPAASPAIADVECRDCLGTGYQRMYTGYGLSDWVAITCGCRKAVAA